TDEQTSGLSQINDAVLQLSDVTQQNAALVEESATASSSLSEQAGMLMDVVSFFKVDRNVANAAAPVLASQRVASQVTATSRNRGESASARPTAPAARMRLAAAGPQGSKSDEWEEF